MTLATSSLLIGRTIVAVDLAPFGDGRGGTAHRPVITLDNGAVLTFIVEETDVGDYGIFPGYHRPRTGPRPKNRTTP